MSPDRETRRRPPRIEGECRTHKGEHAGACRICPVEKYTHPEDPEADDDHTAGQQLLAEIRARRGNERTTEDA